MGTLKHPSLSPHREFLAMVGSEKARATNMNCEVVTVVKHDKSTPVVDITYSKCDYKRPRRFERWDSKIITQHKSIYIGPN